MHKYELTLVLDKSTTLDELTTIRREIEQYVGKVIDYKDWVVDEVKILAYKLDGHTEAGFVYVDLWLIPERAKELEKHLDIIKQVIRYLLVLKEDKNDE